jgi:AcrR family transcriptional regulator
LELLAELGYARLMMDRVVARAGVSKSSLYLRWPNKVALVADALRYRARPVPEVPDTGSLPADMREFLNALRSRHEASRALAAVSGEIATNPELRKAWHRGIAGMLTGCMRLMIGRASGAASCRLIATSSCWRNCCCHCCGTGGWSIRASRMKPLWTGSSASSTAPAPRGQMTRPEGRPGDRDP